MIASGLGCCVGLSCAGVATPCFAVTKQHCKAHGRVLAPPPPPLSRSFSRALALLLLLLLFLLPCFRLHIVAFWTVVARLTFLLAKLMKAYI